MKLNGVNGVNLVASLILIIMVIGSNTTAAQSEISQEKAWFKPELLESNSPICQQMLDKVTEGFFSSKFYTLYQSKNEETLIAGAYGSSNVEQVIIDNKSVYIRIALAHGCGGACEGEQAMTSTSPIDVNMRYVGDFSDAQRQHMPAPTTISNTRFVKANDGNYYLISIDDSVEVNQLRADATWKKACQIKISPTATQYADSTSATQLQNVSKKLELSLLPIIGGYGSCGSSAAGGRQLQLLKRALAMATYRPWALKRESDSVKQSFAYLEKWSIHGLGQYNAYRNFNAEVKEAIPLIGHLYAELYGLNHEDAENMARSTIDSVVAIGIIPAYPPQPDDRKKVLEVLLDKRDLSELKSVITDIKLLDNVNSGGVAYDSLLAIAVIYPEALQYLLDQGLDPNQKNEFGKTALMYAAQYNQLESVAILLSKKADPNLATIIPEDNCNYTLSKSGMRALHYAVRYASPELIKLLIKSGADPIVTTSEKTGGYPIDWMHKYTAADSEEPNANIPASEIPVLEKLLALPTAEEMKKLVLTFNAGAEKAYSEKNLQEAYGLTQKALQLQPANERALSNLGLIAMKLGKNEVALEAIKKLIDHGTDKKMVANAWYNYGMICDTTKKRVYYNGNTYCTSSRIHNYLSSYLTTPSEARKSKLFEVIDSSSKACRFKDGEVTVLTECGSSSWEKKICVIYPSETTIDLSNFNGTYKKLVKTTGNVKVTEEIPVYLNKTSQLHVIGDKTFGFFYPKGTLRLPIKWDGETCNEDFSVVEQ